MDEDAIDDATIDVDAPDAFPSRIRYTARQMPNIAKIERALPLRDQVLSGVLRELSTGRFRPGERLTEGRVATVLGVSRTPVREALGLLAERGILMRRAFGGFVVVAPSAKMLQDTYELKSILEPPAARRAAERITDAELSQLQKALQRLRKVAAKRNGSEVMPAIWEFRRLLYCSSGNDALAKAIEQANDYSQVQFIAMLALASPSIRKLLVARHDEIFAALEARNGAAVERAVEKNLAAWYRSTTDALSRLEPGSA
jgi:DNA-binding GntR family transcriptional regulator